MKTLDREFMTGSRLKLTNLLNKIPLQQCDGLMPDANIWLFIYGDVDFNRDYQTSVYSHFLKIAKRDNISLFTTPIILSEFQNRMIKSPFNRLCQERKDEGKGKPNWKTFRGSNEGIEALESAADNISYILEDCEIIDLISGKSWLQDTSDALPKICGELNDACIEKICVDNNISLVTDDGDFISSNVSIYSANRRLCD